MAALKISSRLPTTLTQLHKHLLLLNKTNYFFKHTKHNKNVIRQRQHTHRKTLSSAKNTKQGATYILTVRVRGAEEVGAL